jgi:hypothetical protein
MTVFWYIASCSLVKVDQCFRGAYCCHHRPDDGSSTQLWNIGPFQRDYTVIYPRRTERCGRVVNIPASYLGRPGFKSRPGDRLCWLILFLDFFSHSKQVSGWCLKLGHNRFLLRPFELTYHTFIRHHILWATKKASLNKVQISKYIPEDSNLHTSRPANLKSHTWRFFSPLVTGMYSSDCTLPCLEFNSRSVNSAALFTWAGACYVICRRDQGSSNRDSTIVAKSDWFCTEFRPVLRLK